jgi:hypothetical protein
MRRLLSLFAVLLVGGVAVAADPPAGRPAFDLTLFTRPPDGGVMILRPAEIAAHSGTADEALAGFVGQLTAAGNAAGFVGELKAEDLPAASAIEQAAFGLSLSLKLSTTEEQGSFNVGGTNFGFLRTTEKFDWAGLLKKAFPKGVPKTHAGSEYLSVGVKWGQWEWAVGFFVADERTLVFDVDADKLEEWLTNRGKRKIAAMPDGWDDVKGCSVAFVMPMGDRSWMTTPAELDEFGGLAKDVVTSLESACVGVTFGDTTAVVGVFTATSDDDAFTVEGGVNKALTALSGSLPEPLTGRASSTTTREGKTVRVEATVKANVLLGVIATDDGGEKK